MISYLDVNMEKFLWVPVDNDIFKKKKKKKKKREKLFCKDNFLKNKYKNIFIQRSHFQTPQIKSWVICIDPSGKPVVYRIKALKY